MKKVLFSLIVVAALVLVAMPVAAQGPTPYNSVASWFNRTAQMDAKWAGDPFGGNPRLETEVKYEPDGKGGVKAVYNSGPGAAWPYTGIVAKFGLAPFGPQTILPGGIPSSMSGDGTNPRKAIYIGGAWADASVNPVCSFTWDVNTNDTSVYNCRETNQTPRELPACATVAIPAGSSKWFKFDTWKKDNAGRRLQTEVWLDDELDGATKPSGKAVFGAANKYYWGTAPADGWSGNIFWGANAMDRAEINGYLMYVLTPNALQPNFAFAPPNAALFTANYTGAGSVRRTCTAAAYAGQPCVSNASGGPSLAPGVSVFGVGGFAKGHFSLGVFNPNQPSHLLWYSTNDDGWYFVRVWNQMIWDGTVSVCSYRRVQ